MSEVSSQPPQQDPVTHFCKISNNTLDSDQAAAVQTRITSLCLVPPCLFDILSYLVPFGRSAESCLFFADAGADGPVQVGLEPVRN